MRLPPMHRQLLGRRVSSWCQRGLATVSTDLPRATPLGPVNGTFGAEVTGVDLTKPLAPPVIKELVNLQNKYGVLAFRSTGLEDDTHVRYSKSFGALESIHGVNKPRRASSPHLYDAGNLDEEGNIIPKHSRAWWHSKGNGLWHTDSSFNQHRSSYSALRAVQLPASGGATLYADMRAAYDDLPADVKEDLKGKIAEHWIWHSRKLVAPQEFDKPTDLEKITIPPAYHTLIQGAPDPSRMTLYIASHVRRIIGMPERESTELIRYLLNHAQQPKYQLSVQWKNMGDLVQWDNRCTMHRATAFKDQANRRDMRRTTVYDHGPYAFGTKLQLAPSQVDVLSGGLIDIAAQPAPETRTRAEIDEL